MPVVSGGLGGHVMNRTKSKRDNTRVFPANGENSTQPLTRSSTQRTSFKDAKLPNAATRHRMDMMQKSVHDLVVEAEKEAHGAAFAGTAMAMALRDNEMLRSIHEQHPQTLLNERERIEIAGIFARHAKARTPIGAVDWTSRKARQIYVLRHKWWYKALLNVMLIGLTLVAFWEPPITRTWPQPPQNWLACSIAELVFALVFFTDLCLMFVCWKAR